MDFARYTVSLDTVSGLNKYARDLTCTVLPAIKPAIILPKNLLIRSGTTTMTGEKVSSDLRHNETLFGAKGNRT